MNRNRRIEKMLRQIESRGGKVGFAPDTPPEVLERFLTEVLQCECCRGDDRAPSRTREH